MKMVDDDFIENDGVDMIDDASQSEQKIMAMMARMAKSINEGNYNEVEKLQTTAATKLNTNSDDNSNYYEITGLPTDGRLYPDGTVIRARPLKVLEVKKLTALTEDNADFIINDVLRKCVKGIDIDDLYISDKIYIIFWLRANSFRDNNYTVDYYCPHCKKESDYHFSINNIMINKIKDSYRENSPITLTNGDVITLNFLKIKDEIALHSFKVKYAGIIYDSDLEIDDELLAISFMINTVNNKHMDPLNKYNYVLSSITSEDYSIIKTYIEDNDMGVKQFMTVTCNKCGGESPLEINFRADFFLPKNRSSQRHS